MRLKLKKISLITLQNVHKRNTGLTNEEVVRQRSIYGLNNIVHLHNVVWLELLKDTLKDPMIWFLLGLGTLYAFLGQKTESTTLFIAVIPLLVMDSILHFRTQASTASLGGQLSTRVNVIREGKTINIAALDIVPGDLVIVSNDEILPADGIFEDARELQIDESIITGESLPVYKNSLHYDSIDEEVLLESESFGQAGTRVLSGSGILRVIFTGKQTNYGEIIQSISATPQEKTPLQLSINKLVSNLIYVSLSFCFILAAIRIYQGHSWLDALISAAVLALAAIPEEFPIVFTFFLGVGVYRLARKKALVRRAVTIENIGRVKYICTDKTGTITLGKLELTHLFPNDGISTETLLKVGSRASDPESNDPIDVALKGIQHQSPYKIFPFTEIQRKSTVLFKEHDLTIAYIKGSPETIIENSNLKSEERIKWLNQTESLAREGHKVIACGKKIIERDSDEITNIDFSGLLAFEDPPREEVFSAIDYCKKNNIKVLMLTGDHPETARAIAKEVGLGLDQPKVISAEKEFNPEILKEVDVVARCKPLQKFNIVNFLKSTGEVIAVTGDGVNDVPALKSAHIGIAMGIRGSQSAKEVSSMILSDDNFGTIISAIKEGKQLFLNLKNSFLYLLLIHIPFVTTAALIPLFGLPLLYLPIHIVWIELVIHPSCLLAFQQFNSEEIDCGGTDLISKEQGLRIVFLGLIVSIAIAATFVMGIQENLGLEHARTRAIVMLNLWSAILVLSISKWKTKASIIITIATLLFTILLVQMRPIAHFLNLSPLHFKDWSIIIGVTYLFYIAKRYALTNQLSEFKFPTKKH